ncbi:MAG: SLBB domain-containing protein [Candidatus Zixiibacteriota bacterium]
MNILIRFAFAGLLICFGSDIAAQTTTSDNTAANPGPTIIDAGKSYRELALEMIYSSGQSGFLDGYIDPGEYTVGPGDEFLISFVSDDQVDISAAINSRGSLFIKSVGSIELGYISLKEASERINEVVSRVFSGVEFSVQIKTFRFTRINVIGQVKQPGTYYVPATWRASELLDLAGGLTDVATRRNIIIKGYGEETNVDIVRFNATGAVTANPLVSRGNTIVVPEKSPSQGYISISGQVVSPGSFEYVDALPGSDYVQFCGGLTGNDNDLKAEVYSADGKRMEFAIAGAEWKNYQPIPGDNLVINWKADTENFGFVSIAGEVRRPGKYKIPSKNFSLDDLLKISGGLTKDGCLERTQVYRLSLKEKMAVVSYGDGQTKDAVTGYLLSLNARRAIDNSKLVFINRDSIYVPVKTGLVSVQGAVAYPGLVRYQEGKDAEYYIEQAGGYGFNADPNRTVVVNQASGGSIPASEAGDLFDGETILVPLKEKQGK